MSSGRTISAGWSCSISRDWSANVGPDTLDINATATLTYMQKPGDGAGANGNSWVNTIVEGIVGVVVAAGAATWPVVSEFPPVFPA